MTEPKVTGWYGRDQTPARKGLYQRYRPIGSGQVFWSYWTGKQWGLLSAEPYRAYLWRDQSSSFQRVRWRGLAEKP